MTATRRQVALFLLASVGVVIGSYGSFFFLLTHL